MKKMLTYFVWLLLLVLLGLYLLPILPKTISESDIKKDEHLQKLLTLRKKPLKSIEVEGIIWQYYTGGSGENVLLFVHGMGGAYDFWWNQLTFFEPNYRVISYTLPPEINSLHKAEKGILAILKNENHKEAIFVGTSMGGYIAQHFMNQHPEKIKKLVLANTFPQNDFIEKENSTKSMLLPLLPNILVEKFTIKHFEKDIFPAAQNNSLLKTFLLISAVNKKTINGRYKIVTEKFEQHTNDKKIQSIPKLILESSNDPLIVPQLRLELKNLYPEAQIYTFKNGGHFPYINAMDTYNKRLKEFFEQ